MNDKEKQLIENYVRTIQAQCELLLWHLSQENLTEEIHKEPKTKSPFKGEKGICDKLCDEKDILNLSTFGGREAFQCKRCGLKIESKKDE